MSLAQFQSDLENGKAMYRKFKGEIEAEGVSLRGNAGLAGDGTKPPLVMQPVNLTNNGGPHAWSPTAAVKANGGGNGNGNGGTPGIPPAAAAMAANPILRAGWAGAANNPAVRAAWAANAGVSEAQLDAAMGGAPLATNGSAAAHAATRNSGVVAAVRQTQSYSSGMGNPSLAQPGSQYGLDALGSSIMGQARQQMRQDRKEAEREVRTRPGGLRGSRRYYSAAGDGYAGEGYGDGGRPSESRNPVMEEMARRASAGIASQIGEARDPKSLALTSFADALKDESSTSGGSASAMKSMRLRAIKYTAAGLAAYTVTNLMGAAEQSFNEEFQAMSDPIKLRMARRHVIPNALGSIPVVGGMLRNAYDFLGGGEADRSDLRAMAFREATGGMSVFNAGTRSMMTATSASTSRSPLLSQTLGLYSQEQGDVASLREERRKALLGLPAEVKGVGDDMREGGPIHRAMAGDFDFRESAVRRRTKEGVEFATSSTILETDIQNARNRGLELTAGLRPIAGGAVAAADAAYASYTMNVQSAESKRPDQARMLNAYRENQEAFTRAGLPRPRDMTEEENKINVAVDATNRLEAAKVRGTIGELRVQEADVLRNIYGGRPTEISGMQSVEAMRDISPETNEDALDALRTEISRLIEAIEKTNAGK
jgi:hypothetical protein